MKGQYMAGGCVAVTGTSTGIGRSAVSTLANAGHPVTATVRTPSDTDRWKGTPNVFPLIVDICDEHAPDLIANCVASHGGFLQALVNNAGITNVMPLEHSDEVIVRHVIKVNLFSPYRITKALLPALRAFRERHQPRTAKVVSVSSMAGLFGWPGQRAYHASKFALVGMSESLSHEVHSQGMHVSVMLPGGVKTEVLKKVETDMVTALQDPSNAARDRYSDGIERLRRLINQSTHRPQHLKPSPLEWLQRCTVVIQLSGISSASTPMSWPRLSASCPQLHACGYSADFSAQTRRISNPRLRHSLPIRNSGWQVHNHL